MSCNQHHNNVSSKTIKIQLESTVNHFEDILSNTTKNKKITCTILHNYIFCNEILTKWIIKLGGSESDCTCWMFIPKVCCARLCCN